MCSSDLLDGAEPGPAAGVLRALQGLVRRTDANSTGAEAGFAATPRALLGLRATRAVGSLDLALLGGVAKPMLRASAAATDFTRCETRTLPTVPRVTTTGRGKKQEKEGTPSSASVLSHGFADGPAGGTAVVRSYKDAADLWHTLYRRFGKTGEAETGEVSLGMDHLAVGVAVNLAGHVLVLTQDMKASGSNPEGKWLSRDGTVLTEWFEIPSMPIDGARFLVDGSMVTSHWGWLNGQFADLQTTVSPLPEWLAERGNNRLAVIRGGKGYGSWGPYSKCGTALEVLTASRQSRGCIAVPGLTPPGVGSIASIGRDGSLIVPRRSDGPCTNDLYPQLLR